MTSYDEGPQPPPRPRKKHRALRWTGAIAALFTAGVIGAAIGSAGSQPAGVAATPAPAVTVTMTPAAHHATATHRATAPATHRATHRATATTAAPPAVSAGEQQAVDAAQGYLSDGDGFSYEGLVQQLTSSYGSGFSRADAVFAVNYLRPDWDAQAVEAAKGYLATGSGYSRSSLIAQLTSSYGSGFTTAQAEYAASQVGL